MKKQGVKIRLTSIMLGGILLSSGSTLTAQTVQQDNTKHFAVAADDGTLLTECKYQNADHFVNGMAAVQGDSGAWG